MGKFRTVEQGEYAASIAQSEGFYDWRHIYDHPQNEALRRKRKDPNVLYPGDLIYIPDKQEKTELGATAQEHVFSIPSALMEIRLQVHEQQDGQALADAAYVLTVGDSVYEGRTDDDGMVTQKVPVGTPSAKLTLPDLKLEWTLLIGHLDPLHQVTEPEHILTGVQSRLANLGYYAGPIDGTFGDDTRTAVRAFQRHILNREDADGVLDEDTSDALLKRHQS